MTEEQAKAAEGYVRAEAQRLALQPDLLHRVKRALDGSIVGEDKNKLLLFLIALTSLGPPDRRLGAIITGESSAGKSWLVRQVLKYFDNKDLFTRLTECSPDRLAQNFDNRILVIEELGGLAAAQGKLRVWISEGHLRLLTTAKDEDGNIVTDTIVTEGVPVFITTTTSVEPDEELMNRVFSLSVDESEEQTRRILEFEARDFMEPAGLEDRHEPDPMVRELLHVNVLRPYDILVPFADRLARSFPIKTVRARRDFKKLLNIICAVTFLHQHQRPIVYRVKVKPHVVALPVDFLMAWRLAEQGLRETLLGVQGRALKALGLFQPGNSLTVKDVAQKLDCSRSRAWDLLGVLVNRGLLDVDDSQKTHWYNLAGEKPGDVPINEIGTLMEGFGEAELKKWFDDQKLTIVSYGYEDEYVDPLTGGSPSGPASPKETNIGRSEEKPEQRSTQKKEPEDVPVSSIGTLPPESVKSVVGLEKPYEGRCHACGRRGVLYHQIETFSGQWGHLCQDCGERIKRALGGEARGE